MWCKRFSLSAFLCVQNYFRTQIYKHCPRPVPGVFFTQPCLQLFLERRPKVNYQVRRCYGSKIPKKEPKGKKMSQVKVVLTDEEMADVIDVETFKFELATAVDDLRMNYIRHMNLRTSLGSIDTLSVHLNKEDIPLNQLAQLSRKNPQLIIINAGAVPQAVPAIIEAIHNSGMNLNPQQEGTTIYLPIPKITKEYRENLAKNARMLFTRTKESIQDIQNKYLKITKQHKQLSEDLIFNTQQQIRAVAADHISKADKLLETKQKDLLRN